MAEESKFPWNALAGVLSSGMNIGSTLLTNAANARAVDAQNNAALERQREANQFNLAMWHMQNEYNSPAAQVKRLKDAGINPALMYGQMSDAGNAQNTPTADAAPVYGKRYDAPQIDPLTAAQIANINADTKQKLKDTDLTDQQIQGAIIHNGMEKLKAKTFQQIYDDGLYDAVQRAGMKKDLALDGISQFQFLNAVWDWSVRSGQKFSDALTTGMEFLELGHVETELDGFGDANGQLSYSAAFSFLHFCFSDHNMKLSQALVRAGMNDEQANLVQNYLIREVREQALKLEKLKLTNQETELQGARIVNELIQGLLNSESGWKNIAGSILAVLRYAWTSGGGDALMSLIPSRSISTTTSTSNVTTHKASD